MFCTKCGVPLRDDDRFCSQCGIATALGRTVPPAVKALHLDKANRKIAGVCSGFAGYFEMDVSLMRVLWLAMIITLYPVCRRFADWKHHSGIAWLSYL